MKTVIATLLVAICFFGTLQAQEVGKIKLGASVGVAMPMGTFGDNFKTGFGGMTHGTYKVNENIDAMLSIGYFTWTSKILSDITMSSVPVLAGGKYYFGNNTTGFRPYGTAELGMHFASVETPAVTFMGVTVIPAQSASESDFGFGLGAGFAYPLNTNLGLDVNAKYNSIATQGSASSYISIMATVLYSL